MKNYKRRKVLKKEVILVNPLLNNIYTYLKASYSDAVAENNMREIGFIFDSELSVNNTRVWCKENENPLILHRGSTSVLDFALSDVLLAFSYSQFDPRYYSAKKITAQVEAKYGKIAYHCGHSLGGFVCESVANINAFVVTYNKGVSPYSILKTIKNPHQTDIRTYHDLVSIMSKFQNRDTITIDNSQGRGVFTPHSIENLVNFNV